MILLATGLYTLANPMSVSSVFIYLPLPHINAREQPTVDVLAPS